MACVPHRRGSCLGRGTRRFAEEEDAAEEEKDKVTEASVSVRDEGPGKDALSIRRLPALLHAREEQGAMRPTTRAL